jgi:hypothetical protein
VAGATPWLATLRQPPQTHLCTRAWPVGGDEADDGQRLAQAHVVSEDASPALLLVLQAAGACEFQGLGAAREVGRQAGEGGWPLHTGAPLLTACQRIGRKDPRHTAIHHHHPNTLACWPDNWPDAPALTNP